MLIAGSKTVDPVTPNIETNGSLDLDKEVHTAGADRPCSILLFSALDFFVVGLSGGVPYPNLMLQLRN